MACILMNSLSKKLAIFVQFLDIRFCIDLEGTLQTDLYISPTDARLYLDFSSLIRSMSIWLMIALG